MDDNQRTLNELLEQGALTIESWLKLTAGFNHNHEKAIKAAITEMIRTSEKYGVHEVIDALTSCVCNKPAITQNELAADVEDIKKLLRKHDEMLAELIRITSVFSLTAKAIKYRMDGNNTYTMGRLAEYFKDVASGNPIDPQN